VLLHESRDDFGVKPFQEKCYNKGIITIVIIKSKDKDIIIESYNPLKWFGSDKYLYTHESFIFSFKSNNIDSSTTI
jgi:hypothetical protein